MSDTLAVPVIDVAPFSRGGRAADAVARQVRAASEEHGFFVISGHSIPAKVNQDLDVAARAFFSQAEKAKQAFAPPSIDVFRGYRGVGSMSTAGSLGIDTLPDRLEFLSFGPTLPSEARERYAAAGVDHVSSFFADNIWPAAPQLRTAVERFLEETSELAHRLLRIFAMALDLEPDWFDDKFELPASTMVINFYPATDTEPPIGQYRRGEHTDYGAFTILYCDGESGLEVKTSDGAWRAVPSEPDTYVVNVGDLLSAWTNHTWRSSLHRVVFPKDLNIARLSSPLFVNPSIDAVVECVPTCIGEAEKRPDPIVAGDWVAAKVAATKNTTPSKPAARSTHRPFD